MGGKQADDHVDQHHHQVAQEINKERANMASASVVLAFAASDEILFLKIIGFAAFVVLG